VGGSAAGGTGGANAGGSGAGGSGSGGATLKNDASASGGAAGESFPGGAGGNSGGAGGKGGGSGSGGATGTGGTSGNGGAASGGAGGGASDASADGPVSTKSYTCNTVLGIYSTSEWYTNGFETYVTDSKWQIIYYHPAYVEDWEDPTDAVYTSTANHYSPCTANSDNPDRVILNVFPMPASQNGTLTTSAAMVTGLSKAVDTIKSKYSRLKRLDLLTMSRGPSDQQCFSSANTVVASYVDDAIAKVVTAYPGLVVASPKFYVTNCSDFDSTNPPHLSTAGKTNMAKVYGDYYSKEP
jgi:hypothetical protein